MHVLVLNGPNLNLLGEREPELYGRTTLPELERDLVERGDERGVQVTCRQSNHEGELVEWVQAARRQHDGIILNAAGYTHTSVALRDALLAAQLPVVEVHLTNIAAREPFRHRSLVSDVAVGTISGFGPHGYRLALDALTHHLSVRSTPCTRPASSEKA
jgi:3-dehydroquinate dehydratase-2